MSAAYWLVKSEPAVFSWDDMVKAKTTDWSGVRNPGALINMKNMKKGDRVFFYHSNEGKCVVGIVEVAKTFYADPKDEKSGLVDVKAVEKLPNEVTLATIKTDPALKDMVLVKNSRLSVQPVTAAEWARVCKLGGVK
ncbi:EVE domain-containing protein [Roseiterribacter gracilis]|uniref:Ubiquinol-cytochrome c reductase n=1 Tax=Roseiterribacter gracilis TaxID=2812848 RepID=A0A8S8XHU2_9PROT|nr:ubiquinol-cytochrome c reductase [Rhodospirillales bacterium TMPK1]